MKTFEVTAHFSHSVTFTVKAKNEEQAMKLVEKRQFDDSMTGYDYCDGMFEELLNVDYPTEIKPIIIKTDE